MENRQNLPVAVIGAGPIGLAAAAHLASRGESFVVLEAGGAVGAAVRAWSHVQVFSPWRYNVDPVARKLLATAGWVEPDPDHLPTGRELVEDYLAPLAALPALAPHIRLASRVVAISRAGVDKLVTAGREAAPFELCVRTGDVDETILARAVIDASGTWGSPNPLGASGLPALGEAAARERIAYGIPDVLGADRARYAGRRLLVVGSGHSAFNVLLDLVALAERTATSITWVIRRREIGPLYGGGAADALPARGALGTRLQQAVQAGRVRLVTGFRIMRVTAEPEGVGVVATDGRALGPFDEIVGATGFRPDLGMLGELAPEPRRRPLRDHARHRGHAGPAGVSSRGGHRVPLPDGSVDVIISNCVINLSANKDAVLAEAFRVLKPGGRLAVSDVVVRGEVPLAIRRSVELWIGCVAGALEESDYAARLRRAGFEDVSLEPTRIYRAEDARDALARAGLPAEVVAPAIDGKFMSAFIRARKPRR